MTDYTLIYVNDSSKTINESGLKPMTLEEAQTMKAKMTEHPTVRILVGQDGIIPSTLSGYAVYTYKGELK